MVSPLVCMLVSSIFIKIHIKYISKGEKLLSLFCEERFETTQAGQKMDWAAFKLPSPPLCQSI